MTQMKKKEESKQLFSNDEVYMDKIYEPNMRNLLKRCYQCARCSGVCQLSKVQKFTPSRIIQEILEGFEEKIITSGILNDCLTCNSCLQNCPEDVNFADIVRMARYKMRQRDEQCLDDSVAHKAMYTTISELMSYSHVEPKRDLSWVPKECEISDTGDIMFFVGCQPYFKFEFDELDNIPANTLKIISKIEEKPIVVRKDENCCGHDLYWGQGKFKAFIDLAKKNYELFERAGVSTIITSCAEGYRTFKVEYPKLFNDFSDKFEVKHILEYIYEKWKQGEIEFKNPDDNAVDVQFTYHDPCRLSRFLPKESTLIEDIREIFTKLKSLGYSFIEMEHNKKNALCCGVSTWMNCNERSKALRYKRLLEAKAAGTTMVTSCPKCIMHFSCLQNDFEDIASIEIKDVSEFLVNLIHKVDKKEEGKE